VQAFFLTDQRRSLGTSRVVSFSDKLVVTVKPKPLFCAVEEMTKRHAFECASNSESRITRVAQIKLQLKLPRNHAAITFRPGQNCASRNPHLACDLAQTNSGSISDLHLLPCFRRNFTSRGRSVWCAIADSKHEVFA